MPARRWPRERCAMRFRLTTQKNKVPPTARISVSPDKIPILRGVAGLSDPAMNQLPRGNDPEYAGDGDQTPNQSRGVSVSLFDELRRKSDVREHT